MKTGAEESDSDDNEWIIEENQANGASRKSSERCLRKTRKLFGIKWIGIPHQQALKANKLEILLYHKFYFPSPKNGN